MIQTIRKLTCSEDELHEAAIRKTGFDDFGDSGYRQGLRILLNAFNTDLQLTRSGWQVAYHMFLDMLAARLYTQKGWAEHPEVLAIPIRRPLIIVGLPRTGTTALHRLLSVDPQFQGLELWLATRPLTRPPRETWRTHPQYRLCVANMEALHSRIPRKMHDFAAGEVEECGAVLMQSFESEHWTAYGLPTYARWLLSQSVRKSYNRYADVLRLIGARESHKTWILKDPYHMPEIDTLLQVFPDACIVQTHRDPLKTIPSFCSLRHMVQRGLEGEAAQSIVLGPRQSAYWRAALDCMQSARQKRPMQFFDVDHRGFLADPLKVVHSIYEHFGFTLAQHTARKMRAWVTASPTSKHGKHEYIVDRWGSTSAQICSIFADYCAQHQFN